jgi:hypothetical protein
MQIRTGMTAAEVRMVLARDPGLADLHLADRGTGWLGGDLVSLVVRLWEDDDRDLIDGGFQSATVMAKIVPKAGHSRFDAERRVIAAILRLIPGDACLASEDNPGPTLLRVTDVVYLDPDWFLPESLAKFGYLPRQLVTGIPPGLATATTHHAAAQPASAAE